MMDKLQLMDLVFSGYADGANDRPYNPNNGEPTASARDELENILADVVSDGWWTYQSDEYRLKYVLGHMEVMVKNLQGAIQSVEAELAAQSQSRKE